MAQIMDSDDIARSLRRIAHEIIERNHGAENLILLGIPTRGVPLAHRLRNEMSEVGAEIPLGTLDITMYRDDLHSQPTRALGPTVIPESIDGKIIVLVDDVLFSGTNHPSRSGGPIGYWTASSGPTGRPRRSRTPRTPYSS